MSWYLDVVINCDLRPDTAQEYIDAIRYLTSPEGTVPIPEVAKSNEGDEDDFWNWEQFFKGKSIYPFLAPDPKNGIITNFYRTPHDFYCLQYLGRLILDDVWANELAMFFYWLPTIASDGFVGYHKAEYFNEVNLLYAKNGKRVDQNGDPLFSGE